MIPITTSNSISVNALRVDFRFIWGDLDVHRPKTNGRSIVAPEAPRTAENTPIAAICLPARPFLRPRGVFSVQTMPAYRVVDFSSRRWIRVSHGRLAPDGLDQDLSSYRSFQEHSRADFPDQIRRRPCPTIIDVTSFASAITTIDVGLESDSEI